MDTPVKDLSEDLHPLPPWVTPMMRASRENAREELQRANRKLLDI